MNQARKLIPVVTLLLGAVLQAAAADKTNLVQDLNIQLVGLQQGDTRTTGNVVTRKLDTVRVGTEVVINALGVASGNTFSRNARLVVVTPLGHGSTKIQVRDGGVSLDVTSLFVSDQLSGSVGSSLSNTRTGRSVSADYSIQRFSLQDAEGFLPLPLHFDVQGIVVHNSTTGGNAASDSELTGRVAGAGDQNGNLLILKGSVKVEGNTLEVVPGGSDPV